MDTLEELAPFAASLKDFLASDGCLEKVNAWELNVDLLQRMAEACEKIFEAHENACVLPKLKAIVKVLYVDAKYWDDVTQAVEGRAVFTGDTKESPKESVAPVLKLLVEQHNGLYYLS